LKDVESWLKGGNMSDFEGNMPPKKMYPQKWPLYDGHSMKAVKQIICHISPHAIIHQTSSHCF
jgi:hypothetical protein